jgi:hypothetical protein
VIIFEEHRLLIRLAEQKSLSLNRLLGWIHLRRVKKWLPQRREIKNKRGLGMNKGQQQLGEMAICIYYFKPVE